jgi:hypothetical protein
MGRRSFADVASVSVQPATTPPIMTTDRTTTGTTAMPPPPWQPHHYGMTGRPKHQNQKTTLEAVARTAKTFAQQKLLEATPADHRAAVDDTLGTYIVEQLQAQMSHRSQQQNSNDDEDDDDDGLEALTELVHDHCHVEWPVARAILDAIVERLRAPPVPVAAPPPPVVANDIGRLAEDPPPRPAAAIPPDPRHFPPLGTAAAAPAGSKPTTISSTTSSTKPSKAVSLRPNHDKTVEAGQVVAALFPPTTRPRSRQSSLDETIASSRRSSSSIDETIKTTTSPPVPVSSSLPHQHTLQPEYYYPYPPPSAAMPYNNNAYPYHLQYQQQFHQRQQQFHQQDCIYTTSEQLLSMNAALSPEAAWTASHHAHGDINLAQYLVECTNADVPICRDFLLHDVCYRADCTFSHDRPEHHTCVFWFKSSCGKGAGCRFLHDFSPRLVQSLPQLVQQQQAVVTLPLHPAAVDNPELRVPSGASSFANVAQQDYAPHEKPQFVEKPQPRAATVSVNNKKKIRTIPIPLEIWNVTENRDAAVFAMYDDPMERYAAVQRQRQKQQPNNAQDNVMDLHYQSLATFPVVLDTLLDGLLEQHGTVWIVTGTGHHVGRRTHQKSGGALEAAVLSYLTEHGYSFKQGKDKTGQGGALFVDGYE